MKKYSFALLLILTVISCSRDGSVTTTSDLAGMFPQPPLEYGPYVWWHWMGSNFSKEGIRKDLEAMKESGIAGATIFNLTSAVQESEAPIGNNPWPDQAYRSPKYWEAIGYAARTAEELGLKIGLHNSPGYSTTGGFRFLQGSDLKAKMDGAARKELIEGELKLLEAEDARWLTKDKLYSVKWLPADVTLIAEIEKSME